MRIALHDYRSDPLLPQKDGVNLAHENISLLMRSQEEPDLQVSFHDFNMLLNDIGYAREVLTDTDCVISNIGPHAHYYFWLRDKLDLDYRIVRDVRTAIWSSYLFQEHLCSPFLRSGDALMFASNYAWGVYEHMFPHLVSFTSVLCYPLAVSFPKPRPAPRNAWSASEGIVTIGYLGRLSEDKNFLDLVELIIHLNREAENHMRYRLVACGDVHSPRCSPGRIQAEMSAQLGKGDWFHYLPARPHSEIWSLLESFTLIVFPSTSNLETFGRVLIEASYARVPVIAGNHAAAPELVDSRGLCAVTYLENQVFSSHFDHSLGRVDIAQMATAILQGNTYSSVSYERYAQHPEILLKLLRDPLITKEAPDLTPSQKKFIRSLRVRMPPTPDIKQARSSVAELAEWFYGLQQKGTPEYEARIKHLREITPYPERTERFIAKNKVTAGDFSNVGGIDIELCHLERFYPEFCILPS